jgi:hypothetical protein
MQPTESGFEPCENKAFTQPHSAVIRVRVPATNQAIDSRNRLIVGAICLVQRVRAWSLAIKGLPGQAASLNRRVRATAACLRRMRLGRFQQVLQPNCSKLRSAGAAGTAGSTGTEASNHFLTGRKRRYALQDS